MFTEVVTSKITITTQHTWLGMGSNRIKPIFCCIHHVNLNKVSQLGQFLRPTEYSPGEYMSQAAWPGERGKTATNIQKKNHLK